MRSQAQSRLEQTRWMMSRSMSTTCLLHDIHIVYSQIMHELQGRVNIKQHRLYVNYINRVAIQQRLLVKFSYDLYIDSLLKALLVCVIIGFCIQWLSQQQNSTISQNSALCRLLFFYFTLYSFLTKGSVPKVKKTYSWALGLKSTLVL